MNINDMPDKVLADMVREGCYSRNTKFDEGTYLLVLAVPYDSSEVETLGKAFDAFHDLVSESDWEERNIQVLTVNGGQIVVEETSREIISNEDENTFNPADNGNQGS